MSEASLRVRPEDPQRIRDFTEKLAPLRWDADSVAASLQQAFLAVNTLAEAEVRYYFRRRNTRAWISGVTRFAGWVLGTLGLLWPLLVATNDPLYFGQSQWGYVFLAGAASALAANSLFGGTSGHVRFVTTQLILERLIVAKRLEWSAFSVELASDPTVAKKGFDLILKYATELHSATIAETGNWGETLLGELAKYEKSIDAERKPQARE